MVQDLDIRRQTTGCKVFKRVCEEAPDCYACGGGGKRKACAFKERRGCLLDEPAGRHEHVIIEYNEDYPDPIYPALYSSPHDKVVIRAKKAIVASYLLPVLRDAHSLDDEPNTTRVRRNIATSQGCLLCRTKFFGHSWACMRCGREVCKTCFAQSEECPTEDCEIHNWVVLNPFQPGELATLISKMEDAIRDVGRIVETTSGQPWVDRDYVPRLPLSSITPLEFHRCWKARIPLVIEGIPMLQDRWTPTYFKNCFGREPCDVFDCEDSEERELNTTVADFMDYLQNGTLPRYQLVKKESPQKAKKSVYSPSSIFKLRDWPTATSLQDKLPELCRDFDAHVPVPHYTRLGGIFSLTSHFPVNGAPPDIGPKLYLAAGCPQDDAHHGSTRLHLDMADAVNIMLWSQPLPDGSRGYARWTIFPAHAYSGLRQFIAKYKGGEKDGDGVVSASVFITDADLKVLRNDYDIVPRVLKQHVRDAVFVPAGCAHQVSNVTACIKMACDFLAPESIPSTMRVGEIFREHRQRKLREGKPAYPVDVMQLNLTLYSTWKALCDLESNLDESSKVEGVPLDLRERILAEFPDLGPPPAIEAAVPSLSAEGSYDSDAEVEEELDADIVHLPNDEVQIPIKAEAIVPPVDQFAHVNIPADDEVTEVARAQTPVAAANAKAPVAQASGHAGANLAQPGHNRADGSRGGHLGKKAVPGGSNADRKRKAKREPDSPNKIRKKMPGIHRCPFPECVASEKSFERDIGFIDHLLMSHKAVISTQSRNHLKKLVRSPNSASLLHGIGVPLPPFAGAKLES